MPVSFQQLRTILKSLEPDMKVYRDEAPTTAKYPYIVYEFVNEQQKRASNQVLYDSPLYQIALVTNGIEIDLKPLKDVFNNHGVSYEQFDGVPYDENDTTVTQFITYVRCLNG